jgi:hypothetical protein
MPQSTIQTGQDWAPVTTGPVRKKTGLPKTNAALSSMKRAGLISAEKRCVKRASEMKACLDGKNVSH